MVKRVRQRHNYFTKVEYVVDPDEDAQGKTYKGFINNISVTGVCMFVFNPLDKGQEIIIKDKLPYLRQRFRVVWIKRVGINFYMTGLMSVGED